MKSAPASASLAGSLRPLLDRIDEIGVVEHSHGSNLAPELGHCTDDAGRALALAAALSDDTESRAIASACLSQLERSIGDDGRFALRLGPDGWPSGHAASDDADARAVYGLSMAAESDLDDELRAGAADLLISSGHLRSHHPRAAAHLVLAGARLIEGERLAALGEMLIRANAPSVPHPTSAVGRWQWPEPRLTYGNALIVEALLELAALNGSHRALEPAMQLLRWLVLHETAPAGHFSFTPVGGRGPTDDRGFDQQPIEAWTLASACARAYTLSGDPTWRRHLDRTRAWFDGVNDVGVQLWDPSTGAAYDGLTPTGPNLNQGAESTLALIGTVRALEIAGRPRVALT